MPPKTATAKKPRKGASTTTAPPIPTLVSTGAGMTAGLELWRSSSTGPFILVDTTADGRFATDVATWNTVALG